MVDEALCDTDPEQHAASLKCFDGVFGDVLRDAPAVMEALKKGASGAVHTQMP
jgi:hypothetical protein